VRQPASMQSRTRPKRTTVVELVAVGIVDLILILAMFHPGIVRNIFTSMPMTMTVLTPTLTMATNWGGA